MCFGVVSAVRDQRTVAYAQFYTCAVARSQSCHRVHLPILKVKFFPTKSSEAASVCNYMYPLIMS